jgi:hypothetical protein
MRRGEIDPDGRKDTRKALWLGLAAVLYGSAGIAALASFLRHGFR